MEVRVVCQAVHRQIAGDLPPVPVERRPWQSAIHLAQESKYCIHFEMTEVRRVHILLVYLMPLLVIQLNLSFSADNVYNIG
jgi:hypothetical protein